jgi:hypothetical protein
MTIHTASCRCGQLGAMATGDPVRVSVCHCLDCKKRSGSAFAVQARWPAERVKFEGSSKSWSHVADSGNRITFHFCPGCGSDVHYEIEGKFDGLIAIPLGAFASDLPHRTPADDIPPDPGTVVPLSARLSLSTLPEGVDPAPAVPVESLFLDGLGRAGRWPAASGLRLGALRARPAAREPL